MINIKLIENNYFNSLTLSVLAAGEVVVGRGFGTILTAAYCLVTSCLAIFTRPKKTNIVNFQFSPFRSRLTRVPFLCNYFMIQID